jgi:glyoxalase/bleomycin resistance protein/dioxygenase superfamily protein
MCLNLELDVTNNSHTDESKRQHFGRIIFHTEDVDKLYSYFKSNIGISTVISFENEPTDAAWGERYFHIREPDGYHLSFAKPFDKKKKNL